MRYSNCQGSIKQILTLPVTSAVQHLVRVEIKSDEVETFAN